MTQREIQSQWCRGFNDGLVCAVEECMHTGFERAGVEIAQQIDVVNLSRESLASLLLALRRGSYPEIARELLRKCRGVNVS